MIRLKRLWDDNLNFPDSFTKEEVYAYHYPSNPSTYCWARKVAFPALFRKLAPLIISSLIT